MKLSVIIPVYNVEDFLTDCLDSVFRQNLIDCEVICIDDGSTDKSLEILESFESQYYNLILISTKNQGVTHARNIGLELAKGDYVFFLDSDDYLIEEKLGDVLQKAIDDKLDMLGFNSMASVGELYLDGDTNFGDTLFNGQGFIKSFFEKNNSFPGAPAWLYLIRKEFLLKNEISFIKGLKSCNDEPFTFKCLVLAQRIKFVQVNLVHYRIMRKGALTHKPRVDRIENVVWVTNYLHSFLKEMNVVDRVILFKIFKMYRSAIKLIVGTNNGAKRKQLIKSKDLRTMHECVLDSKSYVFYWLYKYSFPLYKLYVKEGVNGYFKAFITRVVKGIYNLQIKL